MFYNANNAHGLIAGGREERMREDIEEQFGQDRNETDQIAKRAIEAEGKVNNAKDTNLIVCQLLKGSWVQTDNIEEYEALKELEGHMIGGIPNDRLM